MRFFSWVFILGGIGFAAGFFGPLLFTPDANQGPLIGILMTGPGGAVLGAALWIISKTWHITAADQKRLMAIAGTVLGGVTLLAVLPEPALMGYALDIQVKSCEGPASSANEAVAYWTNRVSEVNGSHPRENWQDEIKQTIVEDASVILRGNLNKQTGIYVARKPWNSGQVVTREIPPAHPPTAFYARYAGGSCVNYPVGKQTVFFEMYNMSSIAPGAPVEWPPKEPARLLRLRTLDDLPEKYRNLLN